MDEQTGTILGTHVGAILSSMSGASVSESNETLSRIETKIDAALSSTASISTDTSASNTTVVSTEAAEPTITLQRVNFLQSKGMDAATGKSISGLDHLRQSLRDIVMTPTQQRVMRRDYGNDVHEEIDSPGTEELLLKLYVQIATALEKWEPRFTLLQISTNQDSNGKYLFSFEGDYLGQYVSSGEVAL